MCKISVSTNSDYTKLGSYNAKASTVVSFLIKADNVQHKICLKF